MIESKIDTSEQVNCEVDFVMYGHWSRKLPCPSFFTGVCECAEDLLDLMRWPCPLPTEFRKDIHHPAGTESSELEDPPVPCGYLKKFHSPHFFTGCSECIEDSFTLLCPFSPLLYWQPGMDTVMGATETGLPVVLSSAPQPLDLPLMPLMTMLDYVPTTGEPTVDLIIGSGCVVFISLSTTGVMHYVLTGGRSGSACAISSPSLRVVDLRASPDSLTEVALAQDSAVSESDEEAVDSVILNHQENIREVSELSHDVQLQPCISEPVQYVGDQAEVAASTQGALSSSASSSMVQDARLTEVSEHDPMSTAGTLQILETNEERRQFTVGLRGKRVLHVKGFGSSFKEPTQEEQGLEAEQKAEALLTMQSFAPDLIVVDGDPWGSGFQVHLKSYLDQCRSGAQKVPTLIWAKDVKLEGEEGRLVDDKEREKKRKKAEEWVAQGFLVVVYYVDAQLLNQRIDQLFGDGFVEDHQEATHDTRGLVKVMSEPHLSWVHFMSASIRESIETIESAERGSKQYFEKCAFENSAKGNLIFDLIHNDESAAHGVVCFGGGESVLLELATKYLKTDSEAMCKDVTVLPFSRGREEEDPSLPRHVGAAFDIGGSLASESASASSSALQYSVQKGGGWQAQDCSSSKCHGTAHVGASEKFVFFIRHAESTWNQHCDRLKNCEYASGFQGILKEGLHKKDHPLSLTGVEQAKKLREIISSEQKSTEGNLRLECERLYYDNFFKCLRDGSPTFSSPLCRALQTAYLAVPQDCKIVLLRNAREVMTKGIRLPGGHAIPVERDCLGVEQGRDLVSRVAKIGDAPDLIDRVNWDASDCDGQWWSDQTENDDIIHRRIHELLDVILNQSETSSCICVTHSNLIRALMMQYGDVDCCGSADPNDEGWQVSVSQQGTLQDAKRYKLQNCGVLGVRFALQDGQWRAVDARLMFDSKLVQDVEEEENEVEAAAE